MTAVIYMRLAWKGSQFSRTVAYYMKIEIDIVLQFDNQKTIRV